MSNNWSGMTKKEIFQLGELANFSVHIYQIKLIFPACNDELINS